MPTTLTELRRKTSFAPTNVLDNLDHWHPNNPSTPRTQDHAPSHIRKGHVLKDTSTNTHLVDDPSYQAGTIDEERGPVLDDLEHTIPEIDLEFFLGNILPPLRDGLKPTEIIDVLEKDGYITDCHWKPFDAEPRSMQGTREQSVLGHLANLFDRIVQAANERPHSYTQTLVLRTDLNWTPSETDIVNRPDGCMVLKGAEDLKASWYDFGLTMEVKKEHVDFCEDNVGKHCRRSTLGIAIENCDMRMWFCSRAVVLVSGGLKFRADLETLVRVFLSFAFASKAELGWDPTVSVFSTTATKSRPRIYPFKVRNEILETVGIMSDLGAKAMIGRATRVFKVKKKDGKDVWVDNDRELEHDLRVKILDDVEAEFNEDIRRRVSKYLLTPIAAGRTEVAGQIDHTTNMPMRGAIPPFDNTLDPIFMEPIFNDKGDNTEYSQTSDQISYRIVRGPRDNSRKRIHHRVHYRVVSREVAIPLHSVKELSSGFTVLRDISKVLEYIHACGWVHRDISAGNTYWYDSKRGLLGDLEYAKKTGVDAEHEVRTGTLDFMAVEIAFRVHLFLPVRRGGARIAQNYERPGLTVAEEREDEFSDAEEGFTGLFKKSLGTTNCPDPGKEPSGGNEGLDEIGEEQENTREIPELEDASGKCCDAMESHNSQCGELDKAEEKPETTNKEVSSNEADSVETSANPKSNDEECPMTKLPLLSYNCLHDMESIWWAAIWMLFSHEDSPEKSKRTGANRIQQAETANELFPRQMIFDKRVSFLMAEYIFSNRTRCLPQPFQDIIEHLSLLRDALRTRYIRAEATLPKIDEGAFEGVHKEFVQTFELTIFGSYNVKIIQLPRLHEASAKLNERRTKYALSSSSDARKRSQHAF